MKLHKALCGSRQAPQAWNAKLDKTLVALGFEKCPNEHAVYKRRKNDSNLLVGVYVDDLLIIGQKSTEVEAFKAQMKDMFSMSDLGLLSYYLGIEVSQSSEGISLCQSAYAQRIIQKAGMENCNACSTPMEPKLKLSKVRTTVPVDSTEFRSIVGSLRYLVHTRPDICHAVGIVSCYMENPTTEHMAAVKHILRYVLGSLNLGCYYKRKKSTKPQLIGYCDSDMGGDVDDRKSTSGVIFYLGENPISWVSQKQKVVALSTCEAEYFAATSAACQGVWLSRLLGDLLDEEPKTAILKVDNQFAISLSKNPVFHDRSKHIHVRYHFARECVETEKISVEYVRTELQLADILTKALGRVRFLEIREKIGMENAGKMQQA
ncbi:uncharacterized protein LOC112270752 [Brachypodium distachyon]|uniref:uncharacterized protein LOC112270752 n=1 Tax=Brachypodium distachyon TaxID=15368 RepID=UPI000D0D148B|nr:uncharacterized protein LOC112270752 [Brachypodium distachyon]|eukprot:XP_024314609.1 uncharacterized protein LOC112270752 [Brachypodium distachyon]